jgi:hypothetical protein
MISLHDRQNGAAGGIGEAKFSTWENFGCNLVPVLLPEYASPAFALEIILFRILSGVVHLFFLTLLQSFHGVPLPLGHTVCNPNVRPKHALRFCSLLR